jgi:hypothetical protein
MHISPDDQMYLYEMAVYGCAIYLSLTMPPKPKKIRYLYIALIGFLAIVFFTMIGFIPDPRQLLNVK